MRKDKIVKIVLITALAVFSGILYSCNTNTVEVKEESSESILFEDNIENIVDNIDTSTSDLPLENQQEFTEPEKMDANTINSNEKATIFVYVCGQVETPGVYELEENARIYEAIEAAGGITEEGSKDYLNQAQIVKDSERIFVPTIEDVELMKMDGKSSMEIYKEDDSASSTIGQSSGGLVNINTASDSELMNLPGIGQSKADKIIAYRESNGGFNSIEDIMQITGIKEGVYNKIKDLITVD